MKRKTRMSTKLGRSVRPPQRQDQRTLVLIALAVGAITLLPALWKVGNDVYASFVHSNRRGAFREVAQAILAAGFVFKVPTPLGRMLEIVQKCGYTHTIEKVEELGEDCDVWVLKGQTP